MAKPTVADVKALTDAELEALQLQVNAEVAARIQNARLENRLVVALTDAQSTGFTDAEIDAVFKKSRDKVQKGFIDPAKKKPAAEPKKPGKDFADPLPTNADLQAQKKAK